jgi:hypothetical protein
MAYIRLLAVIVICAVLAACSTRNAYPGAARPASEVARIKGDPKFRINPVAAYLRSVDGVALADTQAAADVLPGEHELVADCVVSESGDRRRVQLRVVVRAGESYTLEPQLGSANQACVDIRLVKDY